MTRSWIIILFLLFAVYSCSDQKLRSGAPSGIAIETIGPRGGEYTDSTGKMFGYRIFSIRIANDTIIPIALTINFSNDRFVLPPIDDIPAHDDTKTDRYAKVFLFPQSMIPPGQEEVYNYGITGLESFFDAGLSKPTIQKISVEPKQDYFIYIGVLIYPSFQSARADLVIHEHDLLFKLILDPPLDSLTIPCGQVLLKNN